MAVRDDTLVVPTLEQAQAAAEVLADSGAARVLLFGSLARGNERHGGDIDLVAVFEDIDYTERHPRMWALEARCAKAAGVAVDVHVTDCPEWQHRTKYVKSSFEAAISADALTIFERELRLAEVNWDKEIGLPDSDLAEATSRLAEVNKALQGMVDTYRLSTSEQRSAEVSQLMQDLTRANRLISLCGHAAMAIETSLKTLAALNGVESKNIHSISKLLNNSGPLPEGLKEALAPLRENTMRDRMAHQDAEFDDISLWRVAGTYVSAFPEVTPEAAERTVPVISSAAASVSEIIMDQMLHDGADPLDDNIAGCRQLIGYARSEQIDLGVSRDSGAPIQARRNRFRRWLDIRQSKRAAPKQKVRSYEDAAGIIALQNVHSHVCGRRTSDGSSCQRRIAPGGRCPLHG